LIGKLHSREVAILAETLERGVQFDRYYMKYKGPHIAGDAYMKLQISQTPWADYNLLEGSVA